jgi:hypothetical protein
MVESAPGRCRSQAGASTESPDWCEWKASRIDFGAIVKFVQATLPRFLQYPGRES